MWTFFFGIVVSWLTVFHVTVSFWNMYFTSNNNALHILSCQRYVLHHQFINVTRRKVLSSLHCSQGRIETWWSWAAQVIFRRNVTAAMKIMYVVVSSLDVVMLWRKDRQINDAEGTIFFLEDNDVSARRYIWLHFVIVFYRQSDHFWVIVDYFTCVLLENTYVWKHAAHVKPFLFSS